MEQNNLKNVTKKKRTNRQQKNWQEWQKHLRLNV